MTDVSALVEKNIEWTEAKKLKSFGAALYRIEEGQHTYTLFKDGKPYAMIYWGGSDANAAQSWLRANSSKR